MSVVRIESIDDELLGDGLAPKVIQLMLRAAAVGIYEPPAVVTIASVRRVVDAARRAGLATSAGSPDHDDLEPVIDAVLEAMAAAPLPDTEWAAVLDVLDWDLTAALVGVSLSSARRYANRERTTPQPVAERLHFLALTIGDLHGAYNDYGVRRWFARPRPQLEGRAPVDVLHGEWSPDTRAPEKVRELAVGLSSFAAT